jgi:adenylate cyclase
MSLVIRGNGGTLDKYIGDAIMAFWGAPVEDASHARNGVITMLEMQKRASELAEEFKAKGWPPFRIGHRRQLGPHARRRHGLEAAQGVHRDGRPR